MALISSSDIIALYQSPTEWETKVFLAQLLAALRKMRLLTKIRPAVLSVSFVSEQEMCKLNKEFRGKNKPTDVLSFEQPRSDGDSLRGSPIFLGDMVICTPVVRGQAKDRKHSAKKELQVLLAHGLLHLLGQDHEKGAKEAEQMAKLEDRLLKHAFGFELSRGLISRSELFESHVKCDSKPSRTPRRPSRRTR